MLSVGGGSDPKVEADVENVPHRRAHQLRLRGLTLLEVKPAEHPSPRKRLVVLHEPLRPPAGVRTRVAPELGEPPAFVAEAAGFKQA